MTNEGAFDEGTVKSYIEQIKQKLVGVENNLRSLCCRKAFNAKINWARLDDFSHDKQEKALQLLLNQDVWSSIEYGVEQIINKYSSDYFNERVDGFVITVKDEEPDLLYADYIVYYQIRLSGEMFFRNDEFLKLLDDIIKDEESEDESLPPEVRSQENTPQERVSLPQTPMLDLQEYLNSPEHEVDEGPIAELKSVGLDARIWEKGDLSQLFLLIQTSEDYWKPNDREYRAIEKCKGTKIGAKERFIKAWSTIKFNKNGLKQERVLLLTDKAYYTLKFDFSKDEVDLKHCKTHSLHDFYFVEIGILKTSKNNRLVMNVITREEAHKVKSFGLKKNHLSISMADSPSGYKTPVIDSSSSTSKLKTIFSQRSMRARTVAIMSKEGVAKPQTPTTQPSHHYGSLSLDSRSPLHLDLTKLQLNTSSGMESSPRFYSPRTSGICDSTDSPRNWEEWSMMNPNLTISLPDDGSASTSSYAHSGCTTPTLMSPRVGGPATLNSPAPFIVNNGNESMKIRPSTTGFYSSVFAAPKSVPAEQQKLFLSEIAWCLYMAACGVQRNPGFGPFEDMDIDGPKKGVASAFYNAFKIGISKKKQEEL